MGTLADEIIDLYERHSAEWDEDRQHSRPAGERRWLTRYATEIEPNGAVLDLGCGSGVPITSDLVAAGLSVTGVDSSPSLIALCRQRFAEQEWIVADMRRLDLGRRFAGLLAWHSLFHLPAEDQQRMFPRFAAHLAPGGHLMFTSGTERGETIGSWRNEPLYHASLALCEYEALLQDSGFDLVDRVIGDPTCGGATIWLARHVAA